MIKIFLLAFAFLCAGVTANEQNIISYTDESREGQERFFLIATQNGSYTLKSWQFDIEMATWDGNEEPRLSIFSAIEKAKNYFSKTDSVLGVKDVQFRPAFSREGSIVWYYLVTLTTLPYEYDSVEFETVVLLSGEVLEPNGK